MREEKGEIRKPHSDFFLDAGDALMALRVLMKYRASQKGVIFDENPCQIRKSGVYGVWAKTTILLQASKVNTGRGSHVFED